MKINWGKAIVLFFILFISTYVAFIIFTLGQNQDLVSEDYYKKGADYSTQIKIRERSKIFEDSVQIHSTSENIEIKLAGTVLNQSESIKVDFYRPSDKKLDFQQPWIINQPILYIDKKSVRHGRYQVNISWIFNNNKYLICKILDIE